MLPVNVFAQKTPNPNAYKFPTSLELVRDGYYEIHRADLPTGMPFLDAVFDQWAVQRVYVANNFITVIKQDVVEWFEISREIRDFVAKSLRDGAFEPGAMPHRFKLDTTNNHAELNDWFAGRILQATEQDGGGIFLKAYDGGEMRLALAGACNSCPYAQQTVEKGIVEPLAKQLGHLKRVYVEEAQRLPTSETGLSAAAV